MPHDNKPAPEDLHPSLWRASQLARSSTRVVDTGHPVLGHQLPGGGWPTASMVELLCAQNGGGELRLLAPVLAAAGQRRVFMIQPPHTPNALALAAMGLNPSQIVWVQPERTGDALWAAEQTLKAAGAAVVMLWATHARSDSLRRLNLAAAETAGLFFLFRPLAAAQDPSPSPLRLAIRPAANGISVEFLKRKGPVKEAGIFLPLSPLFNQRHASVDRHSPAPITDRGLRALVE
ncbi:translesion DNA synthesis-associated protein ImuA [Massilia sp. LC238]|uniref:translesion DNA synthesis-associated protein ImuA n=1 Tax=Massilia sp. LC238 TaxID=1502852 RepID=UPI0009DF7E27|nr:translesion DNA synthesis-associated protein ImuA [Massilia sp. LC238]